ncbi:hypothetical protein ACFJIV_01760 [Mucilaginibacter sp. UC70_90]
MKKLILSSLLMMLVLSAFAQKQTKKSEDGIKPVGIIKNLTDSVLLDVVQRQTFRYFWDLGTRLAAWPVSAAILLLITVTRW